MPLRAGVQKPEHRSQQRPCGDGFATGASARDVLLGEMCSNLLPLVIAQLRYDLTYMDGDSCRQLF